MRVLVCAGLLAVVISTGCNGFPHPVPISQAELKPEKYPTYAVASEVPFAVGQQRFVVMPGAFAGVATTAMLPVGTRMLFQHLAWDEPPYDQLYVQGSDGLMHVAEEVH